MENDKPVTVDTNSVAEPVQSEKRARGRALLWVITMAGAALAVALMLSLLIHKTVQYELMTPVDRVVDEPYSYQVVSATAENGFLLGYGIVANGHVTIDNTDNEPGVFEVEFTFTTLNRVLRDHSRIYVIPGEPKTATGTGDIELGENWKWNYVVVPPTRKVTRTFPTLVMYSQRLTMFRYIFGLWQERVIPPTR